MCGIVGGWADLPRPILAGAIERGVAALAHRGPDDEGIVELVPTQGDGAVALGHRRLAILDLSFAGHQPMHDPETANWITYNGEVYNFQDLRSELESKGCVFRSDSDTEVILYSYRVWGRECFKRWRGMFAAAIWDAQREELILARDHLGVKPLYYSNQNGVFLFASELRALGATGLIDYELNIAALDSYLMFGATQEPLTLCNGILMLPPANTVTVSSRGMKLEEYWEMPLAIDHSSRNTDDRVPRIGSTLEEAVRINLASDVPLGVFLSGGMDSSALAMLMCRTSRYQVKGFTVSFVNERFDESAQAKETAKQLGIEHHAILLTEAEMITSCEMALKAMDRPSLDGINTYYISRAVKHAGITVALSGLGGDEIFCGYDHFHSLPRMEKLTPLWSKIPRNLRSFAAYAIGPSRHSERVSKLRALMLGDYGFPHPYFLTRTLFLPDQIAGMLEPDAIMHIDYGPWLDRLRMIVERSAGLDPVNRVSYLELKTYVPNILLRDADVMSMAHSLEVRVPLLDYRLVEDVMRLPGRLKITGKQNKPLLVQTLPKTLPRGVTMQAKRGFTLPFAEWLPGILRDEVSETLASPPPSLNGIVNNRAVQEIWHSFLRGDCSWTRPWALYVLYKSVGQMFGPVPDGLVNSGTRATATTADPVAIG